MSAKLPQFVFTQPGPLRLYSTVELLRLPPPTYQVDGVIPEGALVGLYGAPGHGKSFVAVDLAMSIGTGTPWLGRPVQKGFAVYISAEGGAGIGKRVHVWLKEHRLKANQARVAWLTESVVIGHETESLDRLFMRLQKEVDEHPSLFVIDTLARCFEGNENQQEDMGRFIAGVDQMRKEFKSTVVVVHHTGKDGSSERGSTAFRGAVDTMLHVRMPEQGQIVVSCEKQKDDENFADVRLTLRKDEEFNSCVVVNSGAEAENDILGAIKEAGIEGISYSALEEIVVAQGTSRSTFKRRLKALLVEGKVGRQDGIYRRKL